ncbi:hypothetical protein GGTG_07646 [Gaeumannomyces tritici R3-111a-1]|uniref:Uncharacterized protein n=1 Tax=Gaeumannomyces tritici (strain R3-111a-1) TaxID=644352 RepID=J3P298_GAET3|nr:hypothetical protein GGTG_07646 [Gaeumannomyces tritici R3-111a-1]EJT73790.1 hypothetical protein GGTG_07646 [Gaeumannomyces tritici R3-111a-1]
MPLLYVPARDPRHRIACFALYKALLRQVPQVVLPSAQTRGDGTVNPIKHLIRKGFRRNKSYISPRLVTSSLSNGYKFLDLLSAAREPDSPAHKTVLDFLTRYHEDRIKRRRAAAAGAGVEMGDEPPSSRPRLNQPGERRSLSGGRVRGPSIPFLRRVPNPSYAEPDPLGADDDHYSAALGAFAAAATNHVPAQVQPRFLYEHPTRPAAPSTLAGVRGVPKLAATVNGFPFLRVRKPQSLRLGAAIHALESKRGERISRMVEMDRGDGAAAARLEDEWEEMVQAQLVEQGIARRGRGGRGGGGGGGGGADGLDTFAGSTRFGVRYMQAQLQAQRLDQLERVRLLWGVAKEERRLAEDEKLTRKSIKSERRRLRMEQAAENTSPGEGVE